MEQGTKRLAAALFATAAMAIGDSTLAVERLQGAWATSAASCNQVSNTRSAEGWSDFIATGKHVRGAHASCDVISSKQKGDVLTVLLGCETEILFETMSVSIRFKPDGDLVRFNPGFPEVETSCHRFDE
jgi:hypothetical protein